MIKIGRFCPDFSLKKVTGPTNQVERITKGLNRSKFLNEIFTIRDNKIGSYNLQKNVKVNVFPSNMKIMSFRFSKRLLNHEFRNFDLIHSHSLRNFEIELSSTLAQKQEIPFIITPHGSLIGYQNMNLQPYFKFPYIFYDLITKRRPLKNADLIIVNSYQEYLEVVRSGVSSDNIKIVHVALPSKYYSNRGFKKEKHNRKKRILYVGRLTPRRNLKTVIKAAKELYNRGKKDFLLTIIADDIRTSALFGGNYLSHIKEMIPNYLLNKHIFWLGPQFGRKLIQNYHNSDIYVCTSFYENYGQSIAEAAAANLAIVSTPVGIANEIHSRGKGLIILKNPLDHIALADKFELLIEDENLRTKISKNAFCFASENFNSDQVIQNYESIYSKLV